MVLHGTKAHFISWKRASDSYKGSKYIFTLFYDQHISLLATLLYISFKSKSKSWIHDGKQITKTYNYNFGKHYVS